MAHEHAGSLPARSKDVALAAKAGWAAARMAAEQFERIEKENTMQTTDPRTVDDVLQDDAGCAYHQALLMAHAQGAADEAYENFRYDETFPADVLAALAVVKDAEIRL